MQTHNKVNQIRTGPDPGTASKTAALWKDLGQDSMSQAEIESVVWYYCKKKKNNLAEM